MTVAESGRSRMRFDNISLVLLMSLLRSAGAGSCDPGWYLPPVALSGAGRGRPCRSTWPGGAAGRGRSTDSSGRPLDGSAGVARRHGFARGVGGPRARRPASALEWRSRGGARARAVAGHAAARPARCCASDGRRADSPDACPQVDDFSGWVSGGPCLRIGSEKMPVRVRVAGLWVDVDVICVTNRRNRYAAARNWIGGRTVDGGEHRRGAARRQCQPRGASFTRTANRRAWERACSSIWAKGAGAGTQCAQLQRERERWNLRARQIIRPLYTAPMRRKLLIALAVLIAIPILLVVVMRASRRRFGRRWNGNGRGNLNVEFGNGNGRNTSRRRRAGSAVFCRWGRSPPTRRIASVKRSRSAATTKWWRFRWLVIPPVRTCCSSTACWWPATRFRSPTASCSSPVPPSVSTWRPTKKAWPRCAKICRDWWWTPELYRPPGNCTAPGQGGKLLDER